MVHKVSVIGWEPTAAYHCRVSDVLNMGHPLQLEGTLLTTLEAIMEGGIAVFPVAVTEIVTHNLIRNQV